jgi:hypothetical protein
MKYPYVVYWQNKEGHFKWQCFSSEKSARGFQKSLANNSYSIYSYLAKDL